MIGVDRIPRGVVGNRLCKTGLTPDWRQTWDVFDYVAVNALNSLQRLKVIDPVEVCSFRSNRSEVSVITEGAGSLIAWDERFFDYIVMQMVFLEIHDLDQLSESITGILLRYIGECYLFEDPYYAIGLYFASAQIYPRHSPQISIPSDHMRYFAACFRIMRQFVLFHEVGHIAIRNPKFRDEQRKNFDGLIRWKKNILSTADYTQTGHPRFRSDNVLLKSLSQSERAEWARKFDSGNLGIFTEASLTDEFLADIFAIITTWQVEEIISHEYYPHFSARKRDILTYTRIYDAIMLFYFITATMNGVRELFRPKAIRQGFTLDQFSSCSRLVARADVRGMILTFWVANRLGVDSSLDVLSKFGRKCNIRDIYLRTQAEIYNHMIEKCDRVGMLDSINKASRNISPEKAAEDAAYFYDLPYRD